MRHAIASQPEPAATPAPATPPSTTPASSEPTELPAKPQQPAVVAPVSPDPLAGFKLTISAKGVQAGGVTVGAFDLKAHKAEGSEIAFETWASGRGWELPSAVGSVRWEHDAASDGVSSDSMTFYTDVRLDAPVTFDFTEDGMTGALESLVASARLHRNKAGFQVSNGSMLLAGGTFQAGDVKASDARVELTTLDGETISIEDLSAVIGDGGTVEVSPFSWSVGTPNVTSRITVKNMNLAHWLPILTNDRATGEGRVSGSVDAAVDWSQGSFRVSELKGELKADPDHGYIQAKDAAALGDLLEKQDPRFAEGGMLAPVREKIIAALTDFAFKTLKVDLSRRGNKTIAMTYLSGFGRHGEDPQGLNLTLDLHVQDSFLGMAARLAAKARMSESAGTALEGFFQDAAPGEEK